MTPNTLVDDIVSQDQKLDTHVLDKKKKFYDVKTKTFPDLTKGIVQDTFRAPARQIKTLLSTIYKQTKGQTMNIES